MIILCIKCLLWQKFRRKFYPPISIDNCYPKISCWLASSLQPKIIENRTDTYGICDLSRTFRDRWLQQLSFWQYSEKGPLKLLPRALLVQVVLKVLSMTFFASIVNLISDYFRFDRNVSSNPNGTVKRRVRISRRTDGR